MDRPRHICLCPADNMSLLNLLAIEDGVDEENIKNARKIFWNKQPNVLFRGTQLSDERYGHQMCYVNIRECNICSVTLPAINGWFSDERIISMTNTSYMLYKRLQKFQPYNMHKDTKHHIHKFHANKPRKQPFKLLNVSTREIFHNIGNKYFVVSHVWSSNYFGLVNPFSENNKGYLWLKRMSKLLKIKYAWIDTCCINQDDAEEKDREINNMRDYYVGADACAVILSSTNSRDIDEFIANIKLLVVNALDNPHRRLGHMWSLVSLYYSNLLTDEWFKRIWTIQEIMLSKLVVVDSSCGLVDFTELLQCYHVLVNELGRITAKSGSEQVRTLAYHLFHPAETYVMKDILELCAGRKATNSHDYVYGILGLLPNIIIQVNYKLPFDQVVVDLFTRVSVMDLSWIAWYGSSHMENRTYLPVIGSSIMLYRWENITPNMRFTQHGLALSCSKIYAKVISIAQWNGEYAGSANNLKVLSTLCENIVCAGCIIERICKKDCCQRMYIKQLPDPLCSKCNSSQGMYGHECMEHINSMFSKPHDCAVLLLKSDGKYLIGKTSNTLHLDETEKILLMFGDKGWIMENGKMVGIITECDKYLNIANPTNMYLNF
jgi:hypothetical protein